MDHVNWSELVNLILTGIASYFFGHRKGRKSRGHDGG